MLFRYTILKLSLLTGKTNPIEYMLHGGRDLAATKLAPVSIPGTLRCAFDDFRNY